MSTSRRFGCLAAALAAVALVALPSSVFADGGRADAETITAGLFEAMDAGQVDVQFIPLDASKANVLVKNLTDKPVQLRLPSAFAGVPVLAQGMMGGMGGGMGGMGGGMGGMGGGMGGGGGQAMGGGMGGGGMGGGGMGGMGGGMGMMRVAPERMRKFSVTTVCLEHGKPDPNPKMTYKIVPIEQFSKDAKIRVLCEALGDGQVTQNTAQAAAWHIMDNMSWQELAVKNRVESKYLGTIRWFSPIELRTASVVVSECTRIADERASSDSSSSSSANADSDYDS